MRKISYKHKIMEDMDRLLVYELSENLNREQLKVLSENGEEAKSILIYDYLAGDNTNAADLEMPLLEQIIHARYDRISPNEKRYFKFKTPKKELILQQYRKNLSDHLSSRFPKLETKKELKQLYCLDELYSQLNKNRTEKLDFSGDLLSVINSSIKNYINQQTAAEMKVQIEKFWNLATKVDYSNISFNQVKYLKSRVKTITGYGSEKSQDFEIKERIIESKKIISELNKRINEGIENSIEKLKRYFKNLDKKDFMSHKEFLNLEDNEIRLSELESILGYLGDSRASDVSEELRKHSELIQTYGYFCNHKDELNLIIEKQRKLNRKIRRTILKDTFSLLEFFKRNRVSRYITRTEKNLSDINTFYENRYLKKIFDDEKRELRKEFKSLEFGKNWSGTLLMQTVEEASFGNFRRRRISHVTNLLDSINQLEDKLKTVFLY